VSGTKLFILIAVFFLTSVISVVTGSTSLITVPVMIALGIEAHIAIATNMLALSFMSVGGSLPFIGKGVLSRSRLLPSIFLTIIGSGVGALLLLTVPLRALQMTIAVAMIGIAVFSLRQRDAGVRVIYLQIDRSILYEPGVLFTPGVANAVGMTSHSIPEAVKGDMIDFEALYGNIGSLREAGPQARRQKAERAEILVPKRVSIKLIKNLPNG
jgi:uncharacterized membrane protein YfcA